MLPFYLQGSGEQILSTELINNFCELNPSSKKLIDENYDKMSQYRLLNCSEFQSLSSWIISQQISVNQATKLIENFTLISSNFDRRRVQNLKKSDLRSIGLSEQKSATILNIAEKFPFIVESYKDNFQHALKSLIKIKGIGTWTAKMHLLFFVGDPNISGFEDLVARKGLKKLFSLNEYPDIKTAKRLMKDWEPYASVGTILAWCVYE